MKYKTIYSRSSAKHKKQTASTFICTNCGTAVDTTVPGSKHRNHCPHCLWSIHVDIKPGDRVALCNGSMQPLAIVARDDGEYSIIHRCTSCGTLKINRIAGDDDHKQLLKIITGPLKDFVKT